MSHHTVSYLQMFALVLCTILVLEAQAVSNMCRICNCYSPTRITCKGKLLTSIPRPIPRIVKYLNLANNNIEKIEPGTFKNLGSLQELYLYENNISTIEQGTFQGLPRLRILYLKHNSISKLDREMLRNFSSLEILTFEYNKIEKIEYGIFQDLTNLQKLYLNGNNISSIEQGSFKGLQQLQLLSLHINNIRNIEVGIFEDVPSLKGLYLKNNTIENIDPRLFQNLTNLQLLALEYNKIEKIEREIFQDLPNLQKLYLQGNRLSRIEKVTFQDLRRLELLNLANNNIEKIEPGTFKNLGFLQELYLSENNISSIEQGTFDALSRLRVLYLNHNSISKLDREMLRNLFSLEIVTFEFNKIEKIEYGIFQGLTTLKKIYLNGNNISSVDEESFVGLYKLQLISLHNNNIPHIGKETFQIYPYLKELYLYGNNISSIEHGTFRNLPSLEILYLNNNRIEKIPRGFFKNLTGLEILTLGFNKIEKIERGAFEGLRKLQKLYLNGNNISSIELGSFERIPQLQFLSLQMNNIPYLEKGIFEGLSILKKLYLGYNKIEKIERGAFQNLNSLQELYLTGNDISSIENGSFQRLVRLQFLYLNYNQIQKYEDGTFTFLPGLAGINLENNNGLMCGCHLPAVVSHMRYFYGKIVVVNGTCQEASGKQVPILKYSQCQNYSLFQRNLKCQTCSGIKCNDSEVTSCPGTMPVCSFSLSMKGATLSIKRSCVVYGTCVHFLTNNILRCNKWRGVNSCTGCCVGNLCNKEDFTGWTKSFVFHFIIKNFNENEIPTANISRAMEHNLSNVTGLFKVEYCGIDRNRIIFTMYCSVLSEVSEDQLQRNISRVLTKSQALHDIGVQESQMQITSETLCDESATLTIYGAAPWPITKTGTTANIPCHAYIATRYCSARKEGYLGMASNQYTTSPKCSPFTGVWQEPDLSQCYNTDWITRRLKDIARKDIDKGNIGNISKEILDISEKSDYLKEEHIVLTVDILEKMVPSISKASANVTLNNILRSMNNLMTTPEEVLAGAERENRSASRMLNIIEKIPEQIPLEEQQQVAVSYSNLGIGVAKVNTDTFNGLLYRVSYGFMEIEGSSLIYPSTNPDVQEAYIMAKSSVSLPETLLKYLKDEEKSSMLRISFFSMWDDKLYRVTQNSNSNQKARINSHILSANVPDIPVLVLYDPVNITFNLIHQNAKNPQCLYWDESQEQTPHWSPKRCHVSKFDPGKEVICSCRTLASFALLMDVYQDEGEIDKASSILSYIGCGISFVFLVLTIIIHVSFRNLWGLMSSKVLVSLCSSLAVTNVIFLIGMQPYAQIMAVCKAVAAFLHYFLLTSLMWMSVEAFHLLLSIYVALETFQVTCAKSSILAWGFPAVIVIIALAVNYTDNYSKIAQVCWLSGPTFYAAFLAPVAIILIFSLIVSSLVIWYLMSKQRNESSEHKRSKLRVWGLVGLMFLFGFTWAFAYFAVSEATKAFKYLFIIFNTLQGTFIFIFYCIYKKDTRDVIRSFVNERIVERQRKISAGRRSSSVNEIVNSTTETNM